jgi:HAD superfamily hydrolase (TIGR01548 family)
MSELYIKQELLKTLGQLDALILDIDGVVLDVSQSFRVAIADTAQYYATQVLNLADSGPILQTGETELFKMAGGFNSDWDLTNAVVALIVAKQAQTSADNTLTIREAELSWDDYTQAIKRRGGGLKAAEAVILEYLTPSERRDFATRWNPKLVTQLFQEMYAGDGTCRALYGFDPEHIHGEGYYKNEKVILDANLLPAKLKIGIVTGRTDSETRLALKMAGLTQRIPESNWITEDSGVRKPDGRTMLQLREKMSFRYAIFIGDTIDDHQTVLNYRELKGSGKAKIVACTSLSGPSGAKHRQFFLEAGAEIVTPEANMLLQYLNQILPK